MARVLYRYSEVQAARPAWRLFKQVMLWAGHSIHVHSYMCIHTCAFIHLPSYICIHTCAFIHVRSYICIHMCAFIHVHSMHVQHIYT
jgi:hypothetical protein